MLKVTWDTLCDECDHAGVWDADFDMLSFLVGEEVTLTDCLTAFGDRLTVLDHGSKIYLQGFVEFQYGKLNPDNRVHKSVMNRLEKLGIEIKPLASPFPVILSPLGENLSPMLGCKDKDKDKDKELDKEKETDTDKEPDLVSAAPPKKFPIRDLDKLRETWLGTLRHFGHDRNLLASEEEAIARGVMAYGSEAVDLALYGARHEPKFEGFEPKEWVSISRVFGKDKYGRSRFEQCLNWASKGKKKIPIASPEPEEEQFVPTDPEVVRAMLAEAGFAKRDKESA